MRNKIIASFVITLVTMFLVGSALAQQPKRPVLGGYKEINVNGANVKTAAAFAVETQAKKTEKEIELISVIKAEQQVVAGTNIRMCLKVSDEGAEGQDAAEVFVKAVVNFDLKNNKKLLSWEASDCGEEESAGAAPAAVGSANTDDFKTVANSDPGIGLAADFAIKKHSSDTKVKHTLGEILKAENKGMLAMTYRVCMKVSEKNESQIVRAIVSMDQYSNMKLVSWQHAKCAS